MNKIQKLNTKTYKNIIFKMKTLGITQFELSKKIGIVPSTLCSQLKNLENGKPILTDTLFKIAYALDLEITELFK